MGAYKDLKHRATSMLIVVAKDIEEGHYRFSQDNMKGWVQPGFQENPSKEGLIRTLLGNEHQGP